MPPSSDVLTLELKRVLPGPRPVVFRWFSDAQHLRQWWGPQGFTVPSLDFKPRPGHAYRIEMQPPAGEPFYLQGRFRLVEPPAQLAYTFVWEEPDPEDAETRVDLEFRGQGGSTEVVLTQGPFRTEARRALHRAGWTAGLKKLEHLIPQESVTEAVAP